MGLFSWLFRRKRKGAPYQPFHEFGTGSVDVKSKFSERLEESGSTGSYKSSSSDNSYSPPVRSSNDDYTTSFPSIFDYGSSYNDYGGSSSNDNSSSSFDSYGGGDGGGGGASDNW